MVTKNAGDVNYQYGQFVSLIATLGIDRREPENSLSMDGQNRFAGFGIMVVLWEVVGYWKGAWMWFA
jgi:hypothetical protein